MKVAVPSRILSRRSSFRFAQDGKARNEKKYYMDTTTTTPIAAAGCTMNTTKLPL
jgi:hypothetical protein